MIDIELAKNLKDAGLVWKPQVGDWFIGNDEIPLLFDTDYAYRHLQNGEFIEENKLVWLPSLSQRLTEIESRGYEFEFTKDENNSIRYEIYVYKYKNCGECHAESKSFYGNNKEKVAGEALWWILYQEVK